MIHQISYKKGDEGGEERILTTNKYWWLALFPSSLNYLIWTNIILVRSPIQLSELLHLNIVSYFPPTPQPPNLPTSQTSPPTLPFFYFILYIFRRLDMVKHQGYHHKLEREKKIYWVELKLGNMYVITLHDKVSKPKKCKLVSKWFQILFSIITPPKVSRLE